MHRFFVPAEALAGDRFPLPDAISHQVRRVLRLRDGDRIGLLPGDGRMAVCRLEAAGCVVDRWEAVGGEPAHRLTVCQALVKGDGLEVVVRHGTEIGISAFRLIVTERCVVPDLSPARLDRLRTIAREAAEQSERARIPDVDGPVPFASILKPGLVLLAERDADVRLVELPPPPTVAIGPEGGWSPAELDAARAAGVTLAGLGPRILRSDTVALAAAAVVLSRTGDFA